MARIRLIANYVGMNIRRYYVVEKAKQFIVFDAFKSIWLA